MYTMKTPFTLSIIAACSVLLPKNVQAANKYSIDAATRTFRDEFERAKIFHGFNVVVKVPDYLPSVDKFDPITSIAKEDLELMQAWGTKMVRLGVMWEAVER